MRRVHASFFVLLLLPTLLSCRPTIFLAGFGDSLTGGTSWLDELSWRYAVENHGVGGEESWLGLDRLVESLPDVKSDFVVLFWGTNDVLDPGWSASQTLGAMTAAVVAVRVAGKTPVLVVPPPILRNTTITKEEANARLLEIQMGLHTLGLAEGIEVAHLYLSFWMLPEIPDDHRAYFVDGIHFNGAGRAFTADVIDAAVMDTIGG